MKLKLLSICLLLVSQMSLADTPPPGALEIRGATDGTLIGNTGNSLNVNITGGGLSTVRITDSSGNPLNSTSGALNVNTGLQFAPAFTAPAASQPAAVVALSPNSPISVTSVPPEDINTVGTITAACSSGFNCPNGSTFQTHVSGYSTLGYETHGTWVADLVTDISYDPDCVSSPTTVLWYQTASFDTGDYNSFYVDVWDNTFNNDPWVMSVAGAQCARLRAVDFTSGTVQITFDVSVQPSMMFVVDTGNTPSGSPDIGNPVKVGGVYNALSPEFANGQRGDLQIDGSGNLKVTGNFSNPANGNTGSPVPSQATLIGGSDGTDLRAFSVSGSGVLNTSITNPITNYALETGGNLATLVSNQTNGSQLTQVTNFPSSQNVVVTNTPSVTGSGNFTVIQGTGSNLHTDVDNFPATQVVSQSTASNLNATVVQSSGSNLHVNVDSSALPTGAATAANQTNVQSAVGTSATTAITVQGSSSGVAIPVTFTPSGNQNTNLTQINGSTVSTASTGVQKVGITGATGVALDSVAGTPNGQAITIQGNSSGIAVPVTGSGTFTVSQSTASNLNATVVQSSGSNLHVDIDNTPSVTISSGTVTANIGTTGGLALNSTVSGLQVSQGSSTSGQSGTLIQGAVTTSAPTYTTGNTDPLSLDTSGGLRVNGSGYTQPVSGTITANAGTGTFTVGQSTASNLNATVVGTGTFAVQNTQQGTASQNIAQINGSTVSTAATGVQKVGITGSTGTALDSAAGTSNGQAVTIQGNSSGVAVPISAASLPLPTGAATATNQTSQITQETTTASNTTSILANQTNGTQISQIKGNGNIAYVNSANALQVANQPVAITYATQNITAADTNTTATTGINNQVIYTGTPTSNSAATFCSLPDSATFQVLASNAWVGTVQVEVSINGSSWTTRGIKQAGSSYLSSSFTSASSGSGGFEGEATLSGMSCMRVRATAWSSGTLTLTVVVSTLPSSVIVSNPLMLRDSTTQSVTNTIKAASTAAASTDTALVVAQSPNSSLPAGTNGIGYLSGEAVLSTFTQSYSSSNLSTSAFTTIISSTSAAINEEDIFDNSGGLWYLAYASTCGALSNTSNAIIVGPGGGGKNFLIPSGNCVGFEAIGTSITSGNVYMTFYK